MNIVRLPLADRLDRLAHNQAAHPEYDSAVIRSMARKPILTYLGSYGIFCDLQIISGTCMELPYQVTVRVIADLLADKQLTQKDLAEAVNILAAPVVQIQRAYRERNTALLPYREPERAVFSQEHLSRRLEQVQLLAGPPYAFHCLPVQRFFSALSGITGDPGFLDTFQSRILPHMPHEQALFREAVYEISCSQSPDRTDLLYKLLIEPFAVLPNMEREAT